MSSDRLIHSQITADDLLTHYPHIAEYFVAQRMACIGCPISRFHTLSEIARVYGLDVESFIKELECFLSDLDSNIADS